ncbi:MAG TPA: amidohydrolase family protein [Bacteroidia bacterium]|nr:amidohydrolase family protein [Bacteroidia bacterium]
MKNIFRILATLCFPTLLIAQNPAPALPQNGAVLIMNATAHLGNGKVIENSAIGFDNGKLILVADATTIKIDRSRYKTIIDGNGKHVYPGFIACNTTLGLSEIDMVRSTNDYAEVGEMNANVRSIISYNTDSKIIPTVRSNGVLLAQIVPQGGIISGQSSVVELDAWNWEDAAYKIDEGLHLNWPRMYIARTSSAESEEVQKLRMTQQLSAIDLFFREAKAYSMQAKPIEENLRFESMRGLFNGTKKLYVHCDFVKEIVAAVDFCRKYGVQMILTGGADAWRVTGLLKENNIPVVLGRVHSLPPREDDDVDLPYKLPFLLNKAGIVYTETMDGSWQSRNIMFNAGTTAAYGLSKEDALRSLTSYAAQILGIDQTVGTLETGKDATLFISSGDPLDMRTNNVRQAFIAGREINLDNVQKQLYRKYQVKYGIE